MHHLIRIELHRAHNYDTLHVALARRGIIRTITGGDGTRYQLDTGTYYYSGNVTSSSVLELAKAAAPGSADMATPASSWPSPTASRGMGFEPVSMRRGAWSMKTLIAVISVVGAIVALDRILTSKRVCFRFGLFKVCND